MVDVQCSRMNMKQKKSENKLQLDAKKAPKPWSYRPPKDIQRAMELELKRGDDRSEIITKAIRAHLKEALAKVADEEIALLQAHARDLRSKVAGK